MDKPIIADNKPKQVTLEKGQEYYFCTCGRSKDQPFCDGSHKGTTFVPKPFTAEAQNVPVATPTPEEPTVAFIHQFGFKEELLADVQAFHFKGGQGAKTGTGGHLPGNKNIGKISQVRGIPEGQAAISPPTFKDLSSVDDFKRFADRVREITGGIPIGFKLSANHIEEDIQFALDASADYIILDGRGGGTGAAPEMFRDHISVPTIPALARARRYLDKQGASGRVTLIITGGLRVPIDFVKALALGADGVAISNSAMQAIGCVAARMCNSNNCPAGIATQKTELRQRLDIEKSSRQLHNFFNASTELMQVMARACGHRHLKQFNQTDLATWKREMCLLSGVKYSGFLEPF